MRYTISHLGAPIGTVELASVETAAGEVDVTDAYASVQLVIRAASEILWAAGFLCDEPYNGASVDIGALSRAQSLSLELHDERGAFTPTDFINVVEQPKAEKPPVAFVRFRHASSAVPGVLSAIPRCGGEAAPVSS